MPLKLSRRTVIQIMIAMTLLVLVSLLLIVTGRLAIENTMPSGFVTANVRVTAVARLGTPIAPYGALDPAIIPAIESNSGNKPFAVLPGGIQPIGAYLPGIALRPQLATIAPTITLPLAYVTPSATITPLPTVTFTPFPTGLPTPSEPATEAYVEDMGILNGLNMTPNPSRIGSNCAPHGLPVEGVLTQRFHYYHSGIDLGVDLGTSVRATHSGQVVFAGWSPIGYGWLVVIQNEHYITYYGHNTTLNVVQFQYVTTGQIISYSGSTGNSSGPHVHYETRIDDVPVDPLTFDSRELPTC
ncbi:MAG: M23 family metallopeptidase [Chloroflexota bacterium]